MHFSVIPRILVYTKFLLIFYSKLGKNGVIFNQVSEIFWRKCYVRVENVRLENVRLDNVNLDNVNLGSVNLDNVRLDKVGLCIKDKK